VPATNEVPIVKACSSHSHKAVSIKALLDVEKARPVLEQIANKWSVLILTVLCTRPSSSNSRIAPRNRSQFYGPVSCVPSKDVAQ
jgi:hypothetical protein